MRAPGLYDAANQSSDSGPACVGISCGGESASSSLTHVFQSQGQGSLSIQSSIVASAGQDYAVASLKSEQEKLGFRTSVSGFVQEDGTVNERKSPLVFLLLWVSSYGVCCLRNKAKKVRQTSR